jgi:RHS repeat-associated protein
MKAKSCGFTVTFVTTKMAVLWAETKLGEYGYDSRAVCMLGRAQRDPTQPETRRVWKSRRVFSQATTYAQTFTAENKLHSVTVDGQTTTFVYDGDGNRVKRITPEGATYYIGGYYEVQGSTVTKYYYAAGQRVAMRRSGALTTLHSDHLGSTSLTTDAAGGLVARVLYYPYGETRWITGTLTTDFTYTGQRSEGPGLGGLMDYGARHYDAALGRFLSPDAIVPQPGNPQSLNRYSYVLNNPVLYIDPDGQRPWRYPRSSGRRPPPGGKKTADVTPAPQPLGLSEMGGLMLELAVKPENWDAWWKRVVTHEYTDEDYVRHVDYDGTRLGGEFGVGVGDNWKGAGVGVSLNPDNTIGWGYGGSYGPISAAVNPQDGVPSLAWSIPVGDRTTLKPKVGEGVWGVTFKPPVGISTKVGANRFGNYVGVGYTQKIESMSVSGEVTAYGGVIDSAAPIADMVVVKPVTWAYWGAAKSTFQLSVVGSVESRKIVPGKVS